VRRPSYGADELSKELNTTNVAVLGGDHYDERAEKLVVFRFPRIVAIARRNCDEVLS
jgi:hypothetical protein